MITALKRIDLKLAKFFMIEDIELRIKFYKWTFITSMALLIFLYWSCGEVNKGLHW